MTLVHPGYLKLQILTMMGIAVFFACFFIPAPKAHAAELTETQIDAVLNLLESFNASETAIKGVEASLRGTGEISAAKEEDEDDDEDDDADEDDDEDDDADEDNDADEDEDKTNSGKGVSGRTPLCPQLTRLLWKGARDTDPSNPEVKELQQFLANHFGISEEDVATGYFGPVTHWLLVNFQEKEGLPSQGFAGELTRGKILKYCLHRSSENSGKGNAKDLLPRCTLKADEKEISLGETVTLKWESANATYASMPDGTKGPTFGSLQVTPEETTLYQKKVYGPGGEGSCTVEVEVKDENDDTDEGAEENTPPLEVVVGPQGDPLAQVASAVVGVASLPFSMAVDALSNIFLAFGVQ